jgi:hypothetical protein
MPQRCSKSVSKVLVICEFVRSASSAASAAPSATFLNVHLDDARGRAIWRVPCSRTTADPVSRAPCARAAGETLLNHDVVRPAAEPSAGNIL